MTMRSLASDLRYAFRSLTQSPLFVCIAVASIALGVGANTAVFTLLDQVTLRRLPVERPGELAQVSAAEGSESLGGGVGDGSELSWAMYADLRASTSAARPARVESRDHNEVFTGMFARFPQWLHVGYRGQSERVFGELVSGTYFPVLGVSAATGRVLTPDDDRVPNGHSVAMLSYNYWHQRFAGDPAIVGRTIQVNGHPLTVVGVAAQAFHGIDLGTPAQVYVPLMMQPQMGPSWLKLENRRFRWVQVFGRLRPDMSIERAAVALQPYFRSLLEMEVQDKAVANTSADARKRFVETKIAVWGAAHGRSGLRNSLERPLRILMGVAIGVLLIACANVANLLIARGTSRQREIALRLALGASRGRVVRLLFVETLAVALAGGLLGLLLAMWGAGLLLGFFTTGEAPLAVAASPDSRILGFTFLVALVSALIAGVLPAFRSTRLDLAPALKGSGGGVVREQPHLRKALVVVQVALSFLMLAASGVFLRTVDNLLRMETGLVADRVVSFSVDLERSGYKGERSRQFAHDLLSRLESSPGVMSVGFAGMGLLESYWWSMGFTIEGFQPKPGEGSGANVNAVSPGFFRALGIPIVLGRDLDQRDERTPAQGEQGWPYRTAVINETFAKRYFRGRSPIGRHVGVGEDRGTPTPIEIVGVSRDAKYGSMREDMRPQIFLPAFQSEGINNVTAYVRTSAPTTSTIDAARRIVAALDPALPIFNIATMEERVERSITIERLIASLSTGFGVLATLLAVVGLYGVMAYTVARRTREIGIRMALGAVAANVAARVLREAGALVAIGLAIALPAAWWLGRYVESQLYGVKPIDALTMTAAAGTLAMVATLAVLVPARRAARVDPMTALRQD
jgi:predicted permease